MELTGIIRALECLKEPCDITFCSDLWARLLDLCEPHTFHYQWIKGHAGHPENEKCDRMAVAQAAKFKK